MNEEESPKPKGSTDPNIGYSWVVLVSSFLLNVVMIFPFVGFSILYMSFTDAFQTTKAVTGWVGSVFSFMTMVTGLFIAGPTTTYGCRPFALIGGLLMAGGCIISTFAMNVYFLYISYGLIAGFGFGWVNFSAVVIVQKYFNKKRALAGGIALAGQPMGAFLGAIVTRICVERYGWRGSLLLIGGSCLHSLPLAALLHPLPEPKSQTLINTTWRRYLLSIFDFSLMKNLEYVLFSVCAVSAMFGFSMYYLNIPSRAVSLNLTFEQAAWLPPCISLSSCVSRILLSWVANWECTNRLVMYSLLPFAAGLIAITSSLSSTFPYLATNAALYGCMVGSMLSIMPAVEVDMFGRENLARAHALLGLWFGFSVLVTTPLAGFVYDVTESYDISFYIAGAFQFLGCCTMIIILIRRGLKTQSKMKNDSVVTSNGSFTKEMKTINKEKDRLHALTLGYETGSLASLPKDSYLDENREIEVGTAETV